MAANLNNGEVLFKKQGSNEDEDLEREVPCPDCGKIFKVKDLKKGEKQIFHGSSIVHFYCPSCSGIDERRIKPKRIKKEKKKETKEKRIEKFFKKAIAFRSSDDSGVKLLESS